MIFEPIDNDSSLDQQRVDAVASRPPLGTFAVAGVAVALVLLMWFSFYIVVYLARGGH